jgi:hypothetical protein
MTCPRGDCTKKPIRRTAPDQRVCDCRPGRYRVTGAARVPLVPWWCIARAYRDLAVLTVLILWDGCPLGVLVRYSFDHDRRAGLQGRVEKLGHRLPDFLAQSRSVLTEVCDVPLIKTEPRAEGWRAGMNRAPDRLYHAVAVVLCVRVVCTLAENDVAGVPSGIRGSRVENRPGSRGPKGPQAVHIA